MFIKGSTSLHSSTLPDCVSYTLFGLLSPGVNILSLEENLCIVTFENSLLNLVYSVIKCEWIQKVTCSVIDLFSVINIIVLNTAKNCYQIVKPRLWDMLRYIATQSLILTLWDKVLQKYGYLLMVQYLYYDHFGDCSILNLTDDWPKSSH